MRPVVPEVLQGEADEAHGEATRNDLTALRYCTLTTRCRKSGARGAEYDSNFRRVRGWLS